MYKIFEESEKLIQRCQPEISENQLINRGKNPTNERSENIIQKLMYPIRVTFIIIAYIFIYDFLY